MSKIIELVKNDQKSFIKKLNTPLVPNQEGWFSSILEMIVKDKNLHAAPKSQIWTVISQLARDGLMPDGKEAFISTFNSRDGIKITYIPMVKGILKKLRMEAGVQNIVCDAVFKGDDFRVWVDDDGKHIFHERKYETEELDKVYAMATIDGYRTIEVLTKSDVTRRMMESPSIKRRARDKSLEQAINDSPWGKHTKEMWRKSAIHSLYKYIPCLHGNIEIINEAVVEDDGLASAEDMQDVTNWASEQNKEAAEEETPPAESGLKVDNLFKNELEE